jgi:hypothetical protein
MADVVDLTDEEDNLARWLDIDHEVGASDEDDDDGLEALRGLHFFAGARRAAQGPTPKAKRADADRTRVKEKLDRLPDRRFKAAFRMERSRFDELEALLSGELKRGTKRSS